MFIKKKVRIDIRTFFFVLWKKIIYSKPFSSWLFVWIFLYPFSLLYRIFFYIYKITRTETTFYLPIISIGNISVGGTGKSVLTSFLVRNLRFSCSAVLLRGYKRTKPSNPVLIASYGLGLRKTVSLVGDEAAMHAQSLSVPVVVAKKRDVAINYCIQNLKQSPLSYVLLDDGHQHFSVKKTCSIVLLDARAPLGSGSVLPAGDLREKSLKRADVIIFSHAKLCSSYDRKKLIDLAYKKREKVIPVIFGYHAILYISKWLYEHRYQDNSTIDSRRVFVFAGIGSFNQFFQAIKNRGANIVGSKEYSDHYLYSLEDIDDLIHAVKEKGAEAIVTTAKDWVKIYELIWNKNNILLAWFIVHVEFVCTSEAEKRILLRVVSKAIISKYLSI